MRYLITVGVNNLSTETTHSAAFTVPVGAVLKSAQIAVATANCTGVGAALSAKIAKGDSTGTEITSATLDATTAAQEVTFVVPKTTLANIADGQRVVVSVTAAGADSSAATGLQFLLEFARPLQ